MPEKHVRSEGSQAEGPSKKKIRTFFIALDKTLRALKLYSADSPFVTSQTDNLLREADELLEQGSMAIRVASAGLIFKDRPLFPEDSNINFAWAFRLFCDGVRELSFHEGLSWEELEGLLEVLNTNPEQEEDDLVTLLWAKDLDHIRYYAADTFAAGLEVNERGELVLARSKRLEGDEGQDVEEIALAPDDIRRLGGEGSLSWMSLSQAPGRLGGAHAFQVAKLKTDFKTPSDLPRFMTLALQLGDVPGEVGQRASGLILDQLSASMHAQADESMALALRELLRRRQQDLRAGKTRTLAARVLGELLSEESPDLLTSTLERSHEYLLRCMPALAKLGPRDRIQALLLRLPPCEAQQALEEVLLQAGTDLTELFASRLSESDPQVVLSALESLRRIGSEEAVAATSSVLSHPSTEVRHQALEALSGKYHPNARTALLRALRDPSSENRKLALRVLYETGDVLVTRALLEAIEQPDFRKRNLEEQAEFYRALASHHDDRTVAYFRKVLSRKNLFRAKGIIALQLLAVRALAEVGSDKARTTLAEFDNYAFHPRQLKNAVRSALASRRPPSQPGEAP